MTRRPYLVPLFTLVLTATGTLAASPRDELLRLVPEDVGFCLVVQDLRGQAATLRQSAFFKQLQNSHLGEAVTASPEFRKLLNTEKQLQEHLGVDFAQLRDDILGDAVVLAYQPGPPGQPDQEQGLLLVRVGKPELLDRLLERINTIQKQSGELKEVEEREHAGKRYRRRVKVKEGEEFVYRNGPVLAFSSREVMVRRIIDLDNTAAAADKKVPPTARQLQSLGADHGFLSLWVNPRAFDADLNHKAEAATGAEAAFLARFQVYWKALDGVAVYTGAGEKPELNIAMRTNPLALPQPAMKLFLEGSRQSALWAGFPEDALLAVGGRLDLAAFLEVVGEFLTEDARRTLKAGLDRAGQVVLRRNLTTDVLPLMGPDWGFCIMAPPAEDKGWFPHVTAGLRMQPGDKQPPADKAILTAIHAFLPWGVLDYNLKHTQQVLLRSVNEDKVELKYLTSDDFPPGMQPSLGLKDGYLVLASSPAAFQRFQARPAGVFSSGDVPLLRISLRGLRSYLKDRREALMAYSMQKNQLTEAEANQRMDRVLAGLELFDRLELTQRFSLSGNVTWTFRLQPAATEAKSGK